MVAVVNEALFQTLKQSLPTAFHASFKNEEAVLAQAYPLLEKISKDRKLLKECADSLKLPQALTTVEMAALQAELCSKLDNQFNSDALFKYRLPVVLSEFPVHSRVINKAIQEFNALIENHYLDKDCELDDLELQQSYQDILHSIKMHGPQCDPETIHQLLMMLCGWSTLSPITLFTKPTPTATNSQEVKPRPALGKTTFTVQDLTQPKTEIPQNPFIPNYDFNFDGAGRLASETEILLLNAFGMKIGGHFDAQVKYPPKFLARALFLAIIRRQLSHRIEEQPSIYFQHWIEKSLQDLGLVFIQKNEGDETNNILINPFLSEPISFLNPEKIRSKLREIFAKLPQNDLKADEAELDIIAQYLFELIQGFQVNPGLALGIGANWDGTVNLANKASAHAYKFIESEAPWGKRFKQLSLHRQGPSETRMDAGLGVKYEFQAFFSSFDYMNQLQETETPVVVRNALIDNLVEGLLPEPAYYENSTYVKQRKEYVVVPDKEGLTQIDSYLVDSPQGTYFADREGTVKQTPMYRQAGTLDVRAFPKNTTYCEQSRVSYAGNPLGPLQLEAALAMSTSSRGHVVYDPIAADQFLEDSYYGQVIRSKNGDLLPFIGVIPKNFDKHFGQDPELCASFVIRMLQSSRIMEYCPTFKAAFDQLKTLFLPPVDSKVPDLPPFASTYLHKKQQQFEQELRANNRTFSACDHRFFSLFKNAIYSLYPLGRDDAHFKSVYLSFVQNPEFFNSATRAKCEKLIRDLTVNKPVAGSAEQLSRYIATLTYLRQLTDFFYPKPTEDLAKDIAKQASLLVKPLLKTKGISDYFAELGKNRQTNLSSKQSPGMLFAEMEHGGPSKTIDKDYREVLHEENFPSYYNDPNGTPLGKPQGYEVFTDRLAKFVGASAQVLHRYNLFSVIRRPISDPITQARKMAASHRFSAYPSLWALQGAVVGLCSGIVLGACETAITPFHMVYDYLSWQFETTTPKAAEDEKNPLSLPAAPANTPNLKTLAAAQTRDFLLTLLGAELSEADKKIQLSGYISQLIVSIYPDTGDRDLTDNDLSVYVANLHPHFSLNEDEWLTLFKPLLPADDYPELAILLKQNNFFVNKSIIHAVYRCVTNPKFGSDYEAIAKETSSFFSLGAEQISLLKQLLQIYQSLPRDKKQPFIKLFQFNGMLLTHLTRRDQLLQRVQSYMLKVFDEPWLKNSLFTLQTEELTASLSTATLQSTVRKLPEDIKGPLYNLLRKNDPEELNDYTLNPAESSFLLKCLEVFNQLVVNEKTAILSLCQSHKKVNESSFSVKEKAQNKWERFALRELKHQRISQAEVDPVFTALKTKLPDFHTLINDLSASYQALDSGTDQALDCFYTTVLALQNKIKLVLKNQATAVTLEAQTLLTNFLNVTLNAIVNARLDKVDIFAKQSPPSNPLVSSQAIRLWLLDIRKNNQSLRSLLEQQIEQAPSIDHSLWRDQCILQVMELSNPGMKVPKTGIQSLLRFWKQHMETVTTTGDLYYDPQTLRGKMRTSPAFFNQSTTMQHALERVEMKMDLLR